VRFIDKGQFNHSALERIAKVPVSGDVMTPSEKLRYIKGRSLTWGDVGRKLGFKESTMRAYVSKPGRNFKVRHGTD
jgi:hypothetical protein